MSPASMDRSLQEVDPEIARLIREETRRQAEGLELIASENFVSEAVLEAQGSTLTNKYAEGLPGKRYYGGCEVVDKVQQLAIDRAKTLFGAEHANVQPHAGSQANMATYFALLRPGDRIMSLSLAQGGHLTHGSPVNFSGKLFEIHHYGLDPKTELIDYGAARKQAREVRPRAVLCGASAYPRTLEFDKLREIAEEVGAMMICDLRPKKLTGKVAEWALQGAHITTNKNMIPGDPEKPFVTSGLRLGTPALTTRGMGPREMRQVARLIVRVLDRPEDEGEIGRVRGEVHELARQFPLYANRLR